MSDIANTKKQKTCHVYYLNGLNCAHCAAKIEESLNNNEQFESVNFSFATKKLVVEKTDHTIDELDVITKTVNSIETGVTVQPEVEENDEGNDQHDVKTSKNAHISLKEIMNQYKYSLTGFIVLVITLALGQAFPFRVVGFLVAYIFIGGDVAYSAFKNLLKGEWFDENFLMTVATFGAFALGEYVEAVAVMLFYKIGEAFQDYAVDHTRRSIKSLINIKAEYANLVKGEIIEKVDPKRLTIGDTVIIKPGEKIPVDSTIIKGSSTIDASALTGESLPMHVKVGSQLLSGSINLDASITVNVDKTFKESAVAKILDMVENATSKKAKTEQFITKFAKIYTPIVVVAAVMLAVFPPLFGGGAWSEWLSRALIFLVISCPCALVLSVPLGYFGGLGAASRAGILIKGGNYLEALNSIDTFVFDKTGTLTKGNFVVVNQTSKQTLELAAKIEQHSNHPIAKSIVSAYGKDLRIDEVMDVKEMSGEGLCGVYQGKGLCVGNSRLMNRLNIEHEQPPFVGSVVHVAYNHRWVGSIFIADEIKENAKGLASRLMKNGAKAVAILTGDQKQVADDVANQLGIDHVYSELMPGDKLNHVETMIENKQRVLFVGDGINDAPVLARADIGVAMGGVGSDAAVEAADMVIMTDDPAKIMAATKIAKRTRNIVLQNIVFALVVKLVFLTLGATGQANMYEAIFADVGVALIAVLNSMRTLKVKESIK